MNIHAHEKTEGTDTRGHCYLSALPLILFSLLCPISPFSWLLWLLGVMTENTPHGTLYMEGTALLYCNLY